MAAAENAAVVWPYADRNADGTDVIDVSVWIAEPTAPAYIVRLECASESGRTVKYSKLVDLHERQYPAAPAQFFVRFVTGVCTAKKTAVEKLTPSPLAQSEL